MSISDEPSLARVYDYVLGGGYHFAVDRELAEAILAMIPGYSDFARANRALLGRAVRQMTAAGIDQFLDLGCGLLTVGPVHEIAHAENPACRVLYVDTDPIVTSSIHLQTAGDDRVDVVQADLCDVDTVLDHEATRHVLDLERPVGILAVGVLHCLTDQDHPAEVLRHYHDRLAPASLLGASHASGDSLTPHLTAQGVARFADAGITVVSRTREQFAALLGPWQPHPDGVVPISHWRPDTGPRPCGPDPLGYAVMASSTRPPRPGALVDDHDTRRGSRGARAVATQKGDRHS